MTYYRNLLAVAAVAIFYTNAPKYVNQFIPSALPLFWILAFCLLLVPILLAQKTPWSALPSPVSLWCVGYAWLTIMWFFQSSQSELSWQEVRWRFLSIISIMCFLIMLWDSAAIRSARKAIVAATLFGIAINIYEFFVPLAFSAVSGRSAGLYQNPNEAGEILVLGMILTVSILPAWSRAPFMLLTGIGVLLTFSRSGILAWLIAVTAFILVGKIGVKDVLVSSFMGLLLVGVVLLSQGDQLFTTLGGIGTVEKNKDVLERLLWFTDPSGVSDDSGLARSNAANHAWEKIADHPWIGSGTGSSLAGTIASHNQYLSYMQDHGLFVGGAILPLLVLAVIWGASGDSMRLALIFGCTLMWQGLFSHGILDIVERVLLVALMAAMVGTSRSYEVEMTMAVKRTKGEVGATSLWEPQPFRSPR